MKKIITALLLVASFSYAQESAIDLIAKETCECITDKKNDLSNTDKNDLQSILGVCMLKSYTKHEGELQTEEKVSFSDEEGLEKFGESIALKMLNYCPDTIVELGRIAIEEEKNAATNEVLSIEGTVTDIKTEQFVTISVKDKSNRIHKLLLLDYFESASLFVNGEIKKNNKLVVYYSDIELYDPSTKDFKFFKVISGLEKK